MHRVLRRLQADNRGQATILAVVCLLVLALTVLSTMHVSQVVYEKIKLQQAADNLAYSTAVVHARAYNIVAYTNRAMVLHYSAMMTFAAYLSYAQYLEFVIMPIFAVLGMVLEAIGIPGCTIVKGMRYLYAGMDGHDFYSNPFVDACGKPSYNWHGGAEMALAYLGAANEMLYLVQEAALVWAATFSLQAEAFAQRTDPLARLPDATGFSGSLPPPLDSVTNPFVIANGLSVYGFMEHIDETAAASTGIAARKDGLPVYPNYRGASSHKKIDQYSRFLMMEIANASRLEWVATGKGPVFIGRKWDLDFGKEITFGLAPCGSKAAAILKFIGIIAGIATGGALAALTMFFGIRLEKTAETRLRGYEGSRYSDQIISAETFVYKDTVADPKESCLICGITWKGQCKSCKNWILPTPLTPNINTRCEEKGRINLNVLFDNGGSSAPTPGLFQPVPLTGGAENGGMHVIGGGVRFKLVGMDLPIPPPSGNYNLTGHKKHYFKGITPYMLGRPSVDWPQVDHFNQPANVAALVKNIPTTGVTRDWGLGGSLVHFGKHKQLYGKGASLRDLWSSDMAALAAGRAFYHRPGNWQEAPNLFAPLWFARLIPVREHTMFAEGVVRANAGGGIAAFCGASGALFPGDFSEMVCGAGNLGSDKSTVSKVLIH